MCAWLKKDLNLTINFSFGQNINKKIGICATFRTKHGLNKMHPL
jgi:hypothetical protein